MGDGRAHLATAAATPPNVAALAAPRRQLAHRSPACSVGQLTLTVPCAPFTPATAASIEAAAFCSTGVCLAAPAMQVCPPSRFCFFSPVLCCDSNHFHPLFSGCSLSVGCQRCGRGLQSASFLRRHLMDRSTILCVRISRPILRSFAVVSVVRTLSIPFTCDCGCLFVARVLQDYSIRHREPSRPTGRFFGVLTAPACVAQATLKKSFVYGRQSSPTVRLSLRVT